MLYRHTGREAPASDTELQGCQGGAETVKFLQRTSGVLDNIISDINLDSDMSKEASFHLNEDVQGFRHLSSQQGSCHGPAHQSQDADAAKDLVMEAPQRSPSSGDPRQLVPVIRGTLYFTLQEDYQQLAAVKKDHHLFRFFSSGHHESYLPYNTEVGPVDLGVIVSFCKELRSQLSQTGSEMRPLVYYSLSNPQHATNTALLLGCYLIIERGYSAEKAAAVFENTASSSIVPFLDASGMEGFELSLSDCFAALVKSVSIGWFDKDSFDLDEFEKLAHPSGGDVTRIGDKFIAFKGPVEDEEVRRQREAHGAPMYVDLFRRMGVSAVVRLNEAESYDASEFSRSGIAHTDLPFRDCSYPSRKVAKAFLDVCDSEGLVAVHCKAGLGRTGTIIALWMMKHKGFKAKEAIAWLRMSRPGSVIGPQQTYLEKCERREWVGNWMGKTAGEASSSVPRSLSDSSCGESGSVGGQGSTLAADALASKFDQECRIRARQLSFKGMPKTAQEAP